MLKITGDGRKAAFDKHLIDPGAEISEHTKTHKAIGKIYDTWDAGRDKRLTQLVFCELQNRHHARQRSSLLHL